MSKSTVFLKELADQFTICQRELERWQQADGPNVAYASGVTKGISKELNFAFQKLIDLSADAGKKVEDKAKRAVMALDRFALSYTQWLRAANVYAASPGGSQDLWRDWENVVDSFRSVDPPKPHSVKYLIEVANAPREQIAREYGWVDCAQVPDLAKVQEEYEKPGTHFDPKTWVSPAVRKFQASIDERWTERKEPRKQFWPEQDPEVVQQTKPSQAPPPPSLELLLEHDAPIAQICRLHDLTEDEAAELKREYQEKVAAEELAKANVIKAVTGGNASSSSQEGPAGKVTPKGGN